MNLTILSLIEKVRCKACEACLWLLRQFKYNTNLSKAHPYLYFQATKQNPWTTNTTKQTKTNNIKSNRTSYLYDKKKRKPQQILDFLTHQTFNSRPNIIRHLWVFKDITPWIPEVPRLDNYQRYRKRPSILLLRKIPHQIYQWPRYIITTWNSLANNAPYPNAPIKRTAQLP